MTCVGHPCDVWKTRLQAASKGPKVSALRVLTNLVRREGVSSLVRFQCSLDYKKNNTHTHTHTVSRDIATSTHGRGNECISVWI